MRQIPEAYACITEEWVEECHSQAYVLEHKKTGASVFLLENDDPNKVFTIGFRTPPADNTGLPHILEHAVLCGSDKFPVKDPFIELDKSSLHTFLNAMTYPDKTLYPVASCNEKDFRNLVDVYMDAVFHPAIYRENKILRQEGWHCEMDHVDGPLTLNGVVYNEMKGAFSSPEDVLDRSAQAFLYPDTPYAFESGGDPEEIPSLTGEEFLHFHETYYHPSNSFLYLYGSLDMEEMLRWLDREYLGRYGRREIDSLPARQEPFSAPREESVSYSIPVGEDPEGKAYLSRSWVVGDITDPLLYVAFSVLESVLITSPGAPVRQALMDAGIGEDILGGYQSSSRQPFFSVTAKNARESEREKFQAVVERTLREQAEKGIDRKSLQAALNNLEFMNREADFGPYPKGLMFGILSFDSWLYDASPLVHLRWEETFARLRREIDQGYFENLIRRYLLENPHQVSLTLHPVPGLTEEREADLKKRLEAGRAALSLEEREKIVRETEELRLYQSEPSGPEQLATLPVLSLSDIEREAAALNNHEKKLGEVPVLHHEMYTNEILYLRILFRADCIEGEDIPWLGLLSSVLGLMPTQNYSYRDLYSEINLETGGIGTGIRAFEEVDPAEAYAPYLEIQGRALRKRLPRMLELMQEILVRTDFRDEKRLRELIVQQRTRLLTRLETQGHSTALLRAASYDCPASWFQDQVGGIEYGRFLDRAARQMECDPKAVSERLESLARKLFTRAGMVVSLTAPRDDFADLAEQFPGFLDAFPAGRETVEADPWRKSRAPWPIPREKRNEGFQTEASVQYVAQCGNFRKAGYPYTGALRVLQTILSDGYLWNNVRVKGGAYGCMCGFGRTGNAYFVSYRDPHLRRTLDVYRGIAEELESFDPGDREMDNAVIGTIGELDRPMNPYEAGNFSLQCYMCRVTQTMRQRDREEVLTCQPETIRSLAPLVRSILDAGQICVVGNAAKIEEESTLFAHLEKLQGTADRGEESGEAKRTAGGEG